MLPLENADPNISPTEKELEVAAFLLDLVEAQISRADTKAGLVVAADSVFATALWLSDRGQLLYLFDAGAPPAVRVAALLTFFLFLMILLSTMYALVAARPTLKVRDDPGTLFFFSRISQMRLDEYIDTFTAQEPNELRRAVLTEVHNTSQIAAVKFKRVRYSIDFLIAGVVLWGLVQAFAMLTK